MVIELKDGILLRWAWGPRDKYPSSVTASHRLWLTWFVKGSKEWFIHRLLPDGSYEKTKNLTHSK